MKHLVKVFVVYFKMLTKKRSPEMMNMYEKMLTCFEMGDEELLTQRMKGPCRKKVLS